MVKPFQLCQVGTANAVLRRTFLLDLLRQANVCDIIMERKHTDQSWTVGLRSVSLS